MIFIVKNLCTAGFFVMAFLAMISYVSCDPFSIILLNIVATFGCLIMAFLFELLDK